MAIRARKRPDPDSAEAFHTPAPLWPLRLGIAVAVLLFALIIIGLLNLFHGKNTTAGKHLTPPVSTATTVPPTAAPTSTSAPSPPASPIATPDAIPTGADGAVTLPAPTSDIVGVPVGYPHSPVGAISAAYHFETALSSTLDPDRAAAIARVVADSSWTTAAADAAQITSLGRQGLGLPPTATGTQGVTSTVTPSDFMIMSQSPDHLDIFLLEHGSTYDATNPSLNKSYVGVVDAPMHWTGTDWRLMNPAAIPAAERSRLAATTPEAAVALGWRPLNA